MGELYDQSCRDAFGSLKPLGGGQVSAHHCGYGRSVHRPEGCCGKPAVIWRKGGSHSVMDSPVLPLCEEHREWGFHREEVPRPTYETMPGQVMP